MLEEGFSQEDSHANTVEEGWEQTLCCVWSVINGVKKDAPG